MAWFFYFWLTILSRAILIFPGILVLKYFFIAPYTKIFPVWTNCASDEEPSEAPHILSCKKENKQLDLQISSQIDKTMKGYNEFQTPSWTPLHL